MTRSFLAAIGADKPQRTTPPAPAKTTETTTPYGRAVLDNHVPRMRSTPEGIRNDTLRDIGRLLGWFVGGGEITWNDAHDQLWDAAVDSGLDESEVNRISDHLEYGMKEPLAAPNDWTPDKPVHAVPDRPTGLRSKILSRSQLRNLPKPQPLIDGLLTQGTTALLYGKWGSGKSFISLDWACCLATGKAWQTHTVKQRRVLYVAAEGVFGYQARVEAWEKGWDTSVSDEWMSFYPEPVNVSLEHHVTELCEFVAEEGFDVIVLDTLARCTTGADENSSKDIGLVVDALARLRDATPGRLGLALGIHHEGKNGSLRGSTAYEGGVDTVFNVQKGSVIKLVNTKQKDARDGDAWLLKLAPIMGTSSCIIDRAHAADVEPTSCIGWILRTVREHGGVMLQEDLLDCLGYDRRTDEKPAENPPYEIAVLRRKLGQAANEKRVIIAADPTRDGKLVVKLA